MLQNLKKSLLLVILQLLKSSIGKVLFELHVHVVTKMQTILIVLFYCCCYSITLLSMQQPLVDS